MIATDRPEEIGPVDLVMVCVKTPALEAAAESARPLLGPDTVVLGLQNGIDAAERIGAVVGPERVLGAATWIAANIEAPGVIRQVSSFRRIVAGELDGRMTPRLERTVGGAEDHGDHRRGHPGHPQGAVDQVHLHRGVQRDRLGDRPAGRRLPGGPGDAVDADHTDARGGDRRAGTRGRNWTAT